MLIATTSVIHICYNWHIYHRVSYFLHSIEKLNPLYNLEVILYQMKACFRYSIHHHDLPQVVEMSFILSIHQSSFYDCTNIWGSRNCALVDRNVPFTFCQLLLMYFLRKKVFRTLEVQKLNY